MYIVQDFSGRHTYGFFESLEEARGEAERQLGSLHEGIRGGCPDDGNWTGIECWLGSTTDNPYADAEDGIYILRDGAAP